jgi:hypothetical protein
MSGAGTRIAWSITEARCLLRRIKYVGPMGIYKLTSTHRTNVIPIKDLLDWSNNQVELRYDRRDLGRSRTDGSTA